MIVRDLNGRELPLTTKGLYEPKHESFRYWLPLIEFRRAYRNNDTTIRIYRVGRTDDSLKVSFRKPGRSGWAWNEQTGRIGCSFFARQEFFRLYRKAFNKSATKKARAAKAGA